MRESNVALNEAVFHKAHNARGKIKFDVELYMISREKVWERTLKMSLKKHTSIKYDLKLVVCLRKTQDNVNIFTKPCFRAPNKIILSENEIMGTVQQSKENILNSYDTFMKDGSGWVLDNVEFSEITIYKYKRNDFGGGWAKNPRIVYNLLPKKFERAKNKSLITFRPTKDNKCFLHCIAAGIHTPVKNARPNDIKTYQKVIESFNTTGITFPTTLRQISTFESNNKITINVVGLNKSENPYFMYKSCKTFEPRVNLLLHNKHFHLIKGWNPFLLTSKNKTQLCQICGKLTKSKVIKNDIVCDKCKTSTIHENVSFPEKGKKQQFTNYNKTVLTPFFFVCDIETVLGEVQDDDSKTKSKKKKIHKPIAIGIYKKCIDDTFSFKKPKVHLGEDCIEKFYDTMSKELVAIEDFLSTTNHKIDMSMNDEHDFVKSEQCYVCRVNFVSNNLKKMRDHDHYLPKNNYRGAICNSCNLNRTDSRISTPCFFHNASRYDIHFLIKKLNILHGKNPANLIAKTSETIMCMQLFNKKLVIYDSFNHLSCSLATLVEQMKNSQKQFTVTEKCFNYDDTAISLLTRKGIFPYNFLDNQAKLYSTTQLPEKELFYDSLKETHITDEDYEHAKKVWKFFKCTNLADYMKIYLLTDVTLLTDVLINYRTFFYSQFKLDGLQYISSPSFSYDCMLRFTEAQIDFIYSQDIFKYLKKAMRGGVSNVPTRFAEANNPMMMNYDDSKPTTYLIYLDCNSLYSSVMTKKLPVRNLKWKYNKSEEWVKEKIKNYHSNKKLGYFIECDLEYPIKIHDKTKDLPLAPEHIKITKNMLSPYCLKLAQRYNISMDSMPKLISTQYDKLNYVCHIENLQFYLKQGMILKKVHKILQFEQEAVFEPYIKYCVEGRKKATHPDEKLMYKTMANSIFGKCLVNPEKRHLTKILTNEEKVLRAISNVRFKHANVITPNIVQLESFKVRNVINSPYFIGVAILELSKLHLFQLHYDHFVRRFGTTNLKLLMTDTDSLLYSIKTPNVYQELSEMNVIDFSNYPETHQFYSKKNKGKLFYLKDESSARVIQAFCGLRSKSYSIKYVDQTQKTVGKGIPRFKLCGITHEDLKQCLFSGDRAEVNTEQFRSYKHTMFTINAKKIALSPFDNKRYVCGGGIYSLPYGHVDTRKCEPEET